MNTLRSLWHVLAPAFPVLRMRGRDRRAQPKDVSLAELVDAHFREHATPDHPNRESLAGALALLGGKPANILETGSSAWGTNSSRLFDRYVRRFGGSFLTIDVRRAAARALRGSVSPATEMVVGDSLRVLTSLAQRHRDPFDFVYLDSFDLDMASPVPAMVHGLGEFLLLDRLTKSGTLILVDDTPRTPDDWQRVAGAPAACMTSPMGNLMPGKGALVARLVDRDAFEIVSHGYQLLLRRTR